jgi:hypothetical protein
MTQPRILEPQCEWRDTDVADSALYTEHLDAAELAELDAALRTAKTTSPELLDIGVAEFPLPKLGERLRRIEHELMSGRGFAVIRGLPRERYDDDDMSLLYWGIGAHLGRPWAQNHKGHVLGDVIDQGKAVNDPTARGNEVGAVGLPYHSDGSDLVGLLCLQTGAEGGESTVCNAVAIHNDLVRESPELAAALYEPLPYDFRGEQRAGGKPYYMVPVFTERADRLFVRYIRPYIRASQRHPEAPRISPLAERAMTRLDEMTADPQYEVFMDFQPGDMQFINNYHVLHGRRPYRDDPAAGRIRHLKRLWLETATPLDRPEYFRNSGRAHWESRRSVSRLQRPA